MPHQLIRFVPRTTSPSTESCTGCEAPIVERWDPDRDLCARCALEAELYDREARWERRPTRAGAA